MTTDKVSSLQDIGNLQGVGKVVEAAGEKRATSVETVAAKIVDALIPNPGNADLDALLNFNMKNFKQLQRENKASAAAIEMQVETAKKILAKLEQARRARREIKKTNWEKKILTQTEELQQLEAMIEAGEKELDSLDPDVQDLARFRLVYDEVAEAVEEARSLAKAVDRGKAVDEKDVTELKRAYARHVSRLIRNEKLVEVPTETLQAWGKAHESFQEHACSWTYRECETCKGRCRGHWFYGIKGDDKSIAVARVLRDLNNLNVRIFNLMRVRKPVAAPSAK